MMKCRLIVESEAETHPYISEHVDEMVCSMAIECDQRPIGFIVGDGPVSNSYVIVAVLEHNGLVGYCCEDCNLWLADVYS